MDPNEYFDALALVPNFRSASLDSLTVTDLDDGFKFEGHAAVFDEVTDLGEFTESIQRGAFRKALAAGSNVPFLVEHDPKQLLATTRAGTLRLQEDTRGLHVQANVPDTKIGEDVYKMVKRGDLHGMSFGFMLGPTKNHRVERRNGRFHRTLLGMKKLLDVCVTWDPAYPSAEAQFRSIAMQYADSPETWQQLLRGAYPQPEAEGHETDGTSSEEAPAEDAADEQAEGEGDESGAAEQRTLSVAAKKRRLSLFLIEHGGLDP